MTARAEIDSIVNQVQGWPPEDRVALAYQILRDLRRQPLSPAPRGTLNEARGSLGTDRPPPTDEDVRQWLDEHRMGKYGGR